MQDSLTLAHRLKRGDKLWIEGHFVELVKMPSILREPICEVCGFNRNCTIPVWRVCMVLYPDDTYKYGVGKVGRQYA